METYRHPQAIVETDWLETHLQDPSLRILDCTVHLVLEGVPAGVPYLVTSGRADFDLGHIPGADFIDLQAELSVQDSPYSFTLPTAAQFSAAMARHGVGDESRVVLYSTTHPMWATRVWWMLRAFGFDRAAVLNGGFRKWRAEGRAESVAEPAAVPAARFTARPRTGLFTDKHEVLAAIGAPAVCTINALQSDLYVGASDRYGRPGRIPGSVNLPSTNLLVPPMGIFKPAADLAILFASTCPQPKSARVICYCGGGIAATVDAFLLYQLGYDNVAVYDNSMSEWAKDESLPIEVG